MPAGSPGARSRSAPLEVMRLLRGRVGADLTLVGVGGITTAEDARRGSTPVPTCPGLHRLHLRGPGRGRAGSVASGSRRSDDTFGERRPSARRAATDARPALRRHRPARRPARRLGPDRRRRGAGAFALHGGRGVAPDVAAVKPQSASSSGSAAAGSRCWSGSIAESRAAGALVLLDVKRGDIGSTTPGVRRRLPRPGLPARRRRDHRQPRSSASARSTRARHRRRARRRASSCSR